MHLKYYSRRMDTFNGGILSTHSKTDDRKNAWFIRIKARYKCYRNIYLLDGIRIQRNFFASFHMPISTDASSPNRFIWKQENRSGIKAPLTCYPHTTFSASFILRLSFIRNCSQCCFMKWKWRQYTQIRLNSSMLKCNVRFENKFTVFTISQGFGTVQQKRDL